jgi:hypothetical protein
MAVVEVPGAAEVFAELAGGLDEEGAGAHGGVAELEVEDLLGGRALAEGLEDRAQGGADDRAGEAARGVVGAGLAALLAGLEEERAGGHDGGGAGALFAAEGGDASSGVLAALRAARAAPVRSQPA